MNAEDMARLHRAAFLSERPWSAQEFTDLLKNPLVSAFTHAHGFALTRTVAGESELLTLAVDPSHHRQGIARALLQRWIAAVEGNATEAFLEVASDNQGACALYERSEFAQVARRTAYYSRKNATPADAIVMRRALTPRRG